MRIGVTYDLRADYLAMGYGEEETAEFDSEITIEAICSALNGMGLTPVRIGGVKNLIAKLAKGERYDAVFNFCEGFRGTAREAQVPAILDAFDIPQASSALDEPALHPSGRTDARGNGSDRSARRCGYPAR